MIAPDVVRPLAPVRTLLRVGRTIEVVVGEGLRPGAAVAGVELRAVLRERRTEIVCGARYESHRQRDPRRAVVVLVRRHLVQIDRPSPTVVILRASAGLSRNKTGQVYLRRPPRLSNIETLVHFVLEPLNALVPTGVVGEPAPRARFVERFGIALQQRIHLQNAFACRRTACRHRFHLLLPNESGAFQEPNVFHFKCPRRPPIRQRQIHRRRRRIPGNMHHAKRHMNGADSRNRRLHAHRRRVAAMDHRRTPCNQDAARRGRRYIARLLAGRTQHQPVIKPATKRIRRGRELPALRRVRAPRRLVAPKAPPAIRRTLTRARTRPSVDRNRRPRSEKKH